MEEAGTGFPAGGFEAAGDGAVYRGDSFTVCGVGEEGVAVGLDDDKMDVTVGDAGVGVG